MMWERSPYSSLVRLAAVLVLLGAVSADRGERVSVEQTVSHMSISKHNTGIAKSNTSTTKCCCLPSRTASSAKFCADPATLDTGRNCTGLVVHERDRLNPGLVACMPGWAIERTGETHEEEFECTGGSYLAKYNDGFVKTDCTTYCTTAARDADALAGRHEDMRCPVSNGMQAEVECKPKKCTGRKVSKPICPGDQVQARYKAAPYGQCFTADKLVDLGRSAKSMGKKTYECMSPFTTEGCSCEEC